MNILSLYAAENDCPCWRNSTWALHYVPVTDNGELRSWWVAGKKSSLIMWWVQATRQTSRPASFLVLCNYRVLEATEGPFLNKYCLHLRIIFSSSSSFNVSPITPIINSDEKKFAKPKFFNHFLSLNSRVFSLLFHIRKGYSLWSKTWQMFVFSLVSSPNHMMLFVINAASIFRKISFLASRNLAVTLKEENNRESHYWVPFCYFLFYFWDNLSRAHLTCPWWIVSCNSSVDMVCTAPELLK